MPDFNPDEYLKTQPKSAEFNPDSYLSDNGIQKKNFGRESKSTSNPLKSGGVPSQGFPISGNKPLAPTILTPEKQQEYIKSIKTYTKPKAKPKTLKEAVDDDDNYLGALWNTVVGSVSDFAGGATTLLKKSAVESVPLDILSAYEDTISKIYGKALGQNITARPIGDFTNTIRDNANESGEQAGFMASNIVNKARTSSSSEQYEQDLQSGFDLTNPNAGKIAKALPIMITRLASDIGLSIPTGGVSFIAQGYKQGLDDYDKAISESGVEPDNNTRELFGLGYGIVNGALDKIGANAILKNSAVSKSVKNAIVRLGIKQLAKTDGKITSEILERTFNEAAKKTINRVRSGGVKALTAGVTEGGTESIQGGLSDALKVLTNKVKGEEIFDQKELATDFWKNRLNDLAGGAILGGLGGSLHGLRSSNSFVAERVAEATTPEQIQQLKDELAVEIEEGGIEEERAIEINNAIDKYSEMSARLPQDLKPSKKAEAFRLMEERDAVKEMRNNTAIQSEQLDEALAPEIENNASQLQLKEDQLNDQIREKTTGDKYKYFKDPEKDKYYKQLGDGKPEDISQDYYDLQKQDTQTSKLDEQLPTTTETTESVLTEPIATETAQVDIEQNDTPSDAEVDKNPISQYVNDNGVYYRDGQKGELKTEGQTLVFETDNRIFELGDINEAGNKILSDFGIEKEATFDVNINDDNSIDFEGNRYYNRYSDSDVAFNYDTDGNVISVNLETESGAKRTIRGQRAEEIAYQYKLKSFIENATDESIDEAIRQADEIINSKGKTKSAKSEGEDSNTEQTSTQEVKPESKKSKPRTLDYSDANTPSVKPTKAEMSKSREEMGLPEIEVDATQKDKDVNDRANEFIKNGGDVAKLITDLNSGDKKGVTSDEVAILRNTLAERTKKREQVRGGIMNAVRDGNQDNLDRLRLENDILLREISEIQSAVRKGGRETARGLRQLMVSHVDDNSLEGFIENALRNNDGKVLSKEQLQRAEKAFEEFDGNYTAYQAKLAEYEARIEQLEKDYAILRLKKQGDSERTRMRKSLSNEDRLKQIKEERKVILDNLSKIARKQLSNLSANPITLEYFKPMTQLAKTYVEEGIITMDELVSKVHSDIKDYIDGVTERDVRDALSGYGREAALSKDGLQLQIQELKTQMKLVSAIEDAENQVSKTTGTKRKESSDRVKELKQQLFDLTGNDRGVSAFKTRTKNRIADLEARIKKGDYVMPDKRALQLDEEAKVLRDKALKVKREFQIASEKDKLDKRSTTKKAISGVNNVIGLVKSLKSTLDLSAPFRQGLLASIAHPIHAKNSMIGMHKAATNQKFYDRWVNDIVSSPDYELMQQSKLALTLEPSVNMLAREEQFATNLTEKIPLLKFPVKGSERAYSYYLNSMRVNVFLDLANQLESDGMTFETHPEEFKSLARVVNNSTGRGGLGMAERHADLIGLAIWSPRLMASRINTFTSLFDPSYTKKARWMAFQDLYKFIGAVGTVMFLASLNDDWELEWNPLSSNFGKIKRNNARYSIMGGEESYITFMSRILTGKTKTANGIKKLEKSGFGGKSRWDYVGTLFRGKASPEFGILINMLDGRDVVGNEYTWWDIPDEFLPLVIPETMEAYKEGGVAEVIKTIPITTYGVGVSRYKEGEKKKRKPGVWESLYYNAQDQLQ